MQNPSFFVVLVQILQLPWEQPQDIEADLPDGIPLALEPREEQLEHFQVIVSQILQYIRAAVN